ncbi:MAG TPA: D-2-hydroxyacid dehydrogenase, partial [Pirellulaceae bacterium]
MRIVLCYPVLSEHIEQIQRSAPHAEIVDAGQERVATELLEADVYCGHAKVAVDWARIVQRGRLRWIQSSAAGIDHCLTPEVIASDILVTSASGLFANAVAEQTMALLLSLMRRLPDFARHQAGHIFERRPTSDLHRAVVGIAGFGGNGRRIAEVLAPFRTSILATDAFPRDKPPWVEQLWPADRLDEMLSLVDVLILCVPLTPETTGLLRAENLRLLKPHALVINVARGPVIREADLVDALRAGRIAGAGLDVTEIEPLPPTSPLWDMPNVIITPHVGAQSADRVDRTTQFFCDNLTR